MNDPNSGFTSAVAAALELPGTPIQWRSPLAPGGCNGYRDADLLRRVGLEDLNAKLAAFWPRGGRCWGALGLFPSGPCVLVEAKSHVRELYGSCRAAGDSLEKIGAALDEAKARLGAPAEKDWTGPLYQSANRYAHLYFLRMRCQAPVYLVNVYLINDRSIAAPTSRGDRDTATRGVYADLGIRPPVPWCAPLFWDVEAAAAAPA